MTNMKATKRALTLSVVSLIICFTMLLGSTFAWFTDTVSSDGNIIQTGNLDAEMYWANGADAVPAVDSDDWTDASEGPIFTNTLWEPGYTDAKHIMIVNNGSLAFNYRLRIVANGVVSKLADVIDVYYFATATDLDLDSDRDVEELVNDQDVFHLGTLTEILGTTKNLSNTVAGQLLAGETKAITLVLKMQELAGNEYMNLSIGSDFKVELIATQASYESDGFGTDYDADDKVPNADLPAALVRPLEDLDISYTLGIGGSVATGTLDAGYKFEPTLSAENAANSEYTYWHADFAVSADRDVPKDSIILAGYYHEWCQYNDNNWVALPATDNVAAGTEIRLVELLGATVNWSEICQFGNDGIGFQCGLAALNPDALAGTTITVKLNVYETYTEEEAIEKFGDNSTNYEKADYEANPEDYIITIGTFTYTFPKVVSTNEELAEAAAAGGTITVKAGEYTFPGSSMKAGTTIVCEEGTVFDGKTSLNINGSTVVGATFTNDNDYLVNSNTINGTFKDCTFTDCDGLRYCYAGENVVFENCVFDTDFYGIHFDGGNNEVLFKNCTFTGFNTFGSAITKLTMEDCTFKYNGKGGYNGVNLWGNSELTNCTFVFDGSASYEWVDLCTSNQTVTFTNCVVTDGTTETPLKDVVGNYGDNNEIIIDGVKVDIPNMS